MNEHEIYERLAKIRALHDGASTEGERLAALAAMQRIQNRLNAQGPATPPPRAPDPPRHWEFQERECRFTLRNPWSLRLFLALCRGRTLRAYRYRGMRHTSVCVRCTPSDEVDLWQEFLEMDAVLTQHLNEVADRIIADCVNPDAGDAETVAGQAASAASSREA